VVNKDYGMIKWTAGGENNIFRKINTKTPRNTKITKVSDRKSVIFISLCFLFFCGKI